MIKNNFLFLCLCLLVIACQKEKVLQLSTSNTIERASKWAKNQGYFTGVDWNRAILECSPYGDSVITAKLKQTDSTLSLVSINELGGDFFAVIKNYKIKDGFLRSVTFEDVQGVILEKGDFIYQEGKYLYIKSSYSQPQFQTRSGETDYSIGLPDVPVGGGGSGNNTNSSYWIYIPTWPNPIFTNPFPGGNSGGYNPYIDAYNSISIVNNKLNNECLKKYTDSLLKNIENNGNTSSLTYFVEKMIYDFMRRNPEYNLGITPSQIPRVTINILKAPSDESRAGFTQMQEVALLISKGQYPEVNANVFINEERLLGNQARQWFFACSKQFFVASLLHELLHVYLQQTVVGDNSVHHAEYKRFVYEEGQFFNSYFNMPLKEGIALAFAGIDPDSRKKIYNKGNSFIFKSEKDSAQIDSAYIDNIISGHETGYYGSKIDSQACKGPRK